MIGTRIIEIKWNAIGRSFMRLCLAFGAGFSVLALLNKIPEFKLLAQNSTWIPRYIGDSLAFAVGMIMLAPMSFSVVPGFLWLHILFLPYYMVFVRATFIKKQKA